MSDSVSSIGSKLTFFEENIRKSTDSRSKIFIANAARKSSKQARQEYKGYIASNLTHGHPMWCQDDSDKSLVSEADQSLSMASLTLISDDATMNSSRNKLTSSSFRARVTFMDDSINNSATFAQIGFDDSTTSLQHGILRGSTRNGHDIVGNGVSTDASSLTSPRSDSWCGMTIEANKITVGRSVNDNEEFYESFSSLRPASWASPV